jgi:hypothetical protein
MQEYIREEMERKSASSTDERDLEKVEIGDGDISSIIWKKPGKEFTWDGDFFDVVKIIKTDNSTIFYCLRDVREKELVTGFTATTGKDSGIFNLVRIIQKLLIPQSASGIDLHQTIYISGEILFRNASYTLANGYVSVPAEPPESPV